MKFSKYNSAIDITSQSMVLYNSKEDKCVITSINHKQALSLLPKDVEINYPKLYEDLVSINAIVPNNIDELEEVKQLSKKIDNDNTSFALIVNPTMNCNFNCWYCYETHIKGAKMTCSTIDKVKKLIDRILEENKKLQSFNLSFFGGEPLMYYNDVARHIIDYYRNKYDQYKQIDFSINFTSNGYLLNDSIINHLIEGEEPKHFQITLDGGREEHNKVRVSGTSEGSYDKIINAVKKLIRNNIEVLLRVNFTEENIDSTREIHNDLVDIVEKDKKRLAISYCRVWQDGNGKDLNDDVLEIYSNYEKDNFIVSQSTLDLNEFKNSCYADKKNEVLVNFNGDIFKCTAREFTTSNRSGTLNLDGKIDWIDKKIQEWERAKIQSKTCHNCRILPLCGGGCHQLNIENKGKDICGRGFNESRKDDVILYRLANFFACE